MQTSVSLPQRAIYELPFVSVLKRVFVRNHSDGNVFLQQVHFHANQTYFHKNGFALRLVLKQRNKGTRKWFILTPACKITRHTVTYVAALYKAADVVLKRRKRRKFRETKIVLHLSDDFSASVFSARHPDLVAPRSCRSSIQFLRIKNQI